MNNMKKTYVTLCLSAVLCGACCIKTQKQASPFVQIEKGMFIRDGKPYKYIGANFWAWGGLAAPKHLYWQRGDDYTGDPAQEQQGLN